MKIWISLKYRIALIIFLLEAVMMGFVLWGTLGYSLDKARSRVASNEQALLNVISGMGRIALLTDEYADLQPYFEGMLADPHVVRVLLTDARGRVLASTRPSDVGLGAPPMREADGPVDETDSFWRVREIANAASPLGTLAIEFSHRTLLEANAEARNLGLGIAGAGMIVIAFAGVLTGLLLTRRLERLTAAADDIAAGDLNVGIDVGGPDEVGRLAGSFKTMVASVAESQERLQQQADRFRLLLDSTVEGIFGLDQDGNCSFCNAACLAILGYRQADQLLGRNMHSLIHHTNGDGAPCPEDDGPFAKAWRAGERGHASDAVLWRADGTHLLAEYQAVPLRQGDALVGAVVSFSDVTEIRRGEAALRRSQRLASVAQLTGGIAHDFNNILGIAIGNLELVEDKTGGDRDVRDRLDRVQRALERGAKLTRRLLLFSADTPQARNPVNLNKTIAAMDDLITSSLTPQIGVELRLDGNVWLTNLDPGEFEDVLINLALNARDAMDGVGRLVIETSNVTLDEDGLAHHAETRAGDYVRVSVRDDGAGMSGDVIDRIFEPFFTTKERGKGTGLGLSMAYGFVTRLDGIIDVESEPGAGTSVHLYLPRSEEAVLDVVEDAADLAAIPGGEETVLVVEDEVDLLNFAIRTLTDKGYRVLRAQDAAEAMAHLEAPEPIDLLFSDVVLPGGQNGLDLALIARDLHPGLRVLIASGYAAGIQDADRYGDLLTTILQKPYRGAQLLRCARTALNSPLEGTVEASTPLWKSSL